MIVWHFRDRTQYSVGIIYIIINQFQYFDTMEYNTIKTICRYRVVVIGSPQRGAASPRGIGSQGQTDGQRTEKAI